MEEMHLNRDFSVNSEGQLCVGGQVVDSNMILFEEQAKSLLEKELMEGPLNYDPANDDDDYQSFDEDIYDHLLDNDISMNDDNFSSEGGFFDINNDEFDAIN